VTITQMEKCDLEFIIIASFVSAPSKSSNRANSQT